MGKGVESSTSSSISNRVNPPYLGSSSVVVVGAEMGASVMLRVSRAGDASPITD